MQEKPNKEQFEDYVIVQNMGIVNMFDVVTVCAFSTHGLTEAHCRYIYDHYSELLDEYDLGDGVMKCR